MMHAECRGCFENVDHKPITRRNEYVVLYRRQNSDIYGVATAIWAYDGRPGWSNCSQPGQPEVIQWFDPDLGKFIDRARTPDAH